MYTLARITFPFLYPVRPSCNISYLMTISSRLGRLMYSLLASVYKINSRVMRTGVIFSHIKRWRFFECRAQLANPAFTRVVSLANCTNRTERSFYISAIYLNKLPQLARYAINISPMWQNIFRCKKKLLRLKYDFIVWNDHMTPLYTGKKLK